MLVEIRVRDLGVIEDLCLVLGAGMTALTGETGAGKTLVVEALELLVGGRADATLVRTGAEVAVVEGRFLLRASPKADTGIGDDTGTGTGTEEIVVSREIPADGRSRAYLNGRMASVAALADAGARLVDLHGQHSHQSLLHQSAQREALDKFGDTDLTEVMEAEACVHELERRLEDLGGDARQLAREADLLAYQVAELESAQLDDPDEERALESEEAMLGAADALRLAASSARERLSDDSGTDRPAATELLSVAANELAAHTQLRDLADRLRAALDDATDVAAELRHRAESFEADPDRLAQVQQRQRQLHELRRKYGERLSDVIGYRDITRQRLADLNAGEARRDEIEGELAAARKALADAEHRLGDQRRAAAPRLSKEIAGHLADLALPRGRLEVRVGAGKGDEVSWLFAASPGESALPLEKVASGGELARVMLATRLVLSEAPPTLVFDEVDAGIGGQAALAVGKALHALAAAGHQVLVVTHLAQVAAFADDQVAVAKADSRGRTVASARTLDTEGRLAELSRMLSGQPESATARRHAGELLELATGLRSECRDLPSRAP